MHDVSGAGFFFGINFNPAQHVLDRALPQQQLLLLVVADLADDVQRRRQRAPGRVGAEAAPHAVGRRKVVVREQREQRLVRRGAAGDRAARPESRTYSSPLVVPGTPRRCTHV